MKLSEITIYDYDNHSIKISLPDKDIQEIFVHILSGDETGEVVFNDGTSVSFDACPDGRITGYDDGGYIVPEPLIEEWVNYEPTNITWWDTVAYMRYAYMRQVEFACREEVNDEQ